MRKEFIKLLTEAAGLDDRIYLLTADLGFMVVEPFQEAFPDRFINVGCAEQAMLGTAIGLAAKGKIPFCYSIATFASMRPLEFIRHAAHCELPIRVVGAGRGQEYGSAGFTHWALEDQELMKAIGVNTYFPSNDEELRIAITGLCQRGIRTSYLSLKKG